MMKILHRILLPKNPILPIVFSVLSVAILQGAFLFWEKVTSFNITTGIILSAIAVCVAILWLLTKRTGLFPVLLYLYWTLLAVFSIHLIHGKPSVAPPLLHIFLGLLHGWTLLLLIDWQFRHPRLRKILSGISVFFLLVFLLEVLLHALSLQPASAEVGGVARSLPTSQKPTPVIEESGTQNKRIWLRTDGGSAAGLEFKKTTVRIAIQNVRSGKPFDVQLNISQLPVKAKKRYSIKFQGRADRNRRIYVGFARSHDPWDGLGFYKAILLTPQWQNFEEEFTSRDDDQNARIHFDVGEENIPVEVSSIEFFPSDNKKPKTAEKTAVHHKYNSVGCRGRDYEVPKPLHVRRILVLGDDQVFGIDLPETDTFVSRLNQRLNTLRQNENSTEVINCGLRGAGLKELRTFYESHGSGYDPDIVLLVLSLRASADRLENRIDSESPSMILNWLRRSTEVPFQPRFQALRNELFGLTNAVRKQNRKFAIILFRDDTDYAGHTERGKAWNRLTEIIQPVVQESQLPVLDLGSISSRYDTKTALSSFDDPAPNAVAHRLASDEILRFLRQQNLTAESW